MPVLKSDSKKQIPSCENNSCLASQEHSPPFMKLLISARHQSVSQDR